MGPLSYLPSGLPETIGPNILPYCIGDFWIIWVWRVDPQRAGIILSDRSKSPSLSLTYPNISLLATTLPPSWILNAKKHHYHQRRRRRRKKATWYGSKKGQSGIEVWWWCSAAAADSDKNYPKLQIMRWKAKCRRHMKVGAVGRESPREKNDLLSHSNNTLEPISKE